MRSFAVIAGLAASANAYAYGYPEAYNTTSSAAHYAESSSAPAYPAVSSSAAYGEYPASSSAAYPVSTPVYETKVVTGLTTVCPEPTTVSYAGKTYVVSTSTTLIDEECETTVTYEVKPTPSAAHPTSSHVGTPSGSHYAPAPYSSAPAAEHVPYPSAPAAGNATTPYPTGVKPSATKPAVPEFTGAAGKATVGVLAIVGAMAAFL